MKLGLVVLGLLLATPAIGESLVSTLSDDAIQITSSFTGERIVVFGAVSDALPAAAGEYEVAVVVQGPPQNVIVRRKQRVLGVWANREAKSFSEVPSYYVMHVSPNFNQAVSSGELQQYRLGLRSLPFTQAGGDPSSAAFARAVINLKTSRGLYAERDSFVQFINPSVFRTTFFLPSQIPTGEYRISVYLFRDQSFLGGTTETLRVAKSGFSDRIARFADQNALVYGFMCVGLAVLTGWLAGVIFRRP
jgi:uncharacterized protein (TIGR02186 family)